MHLGEVVDHESVGHEDQEPVGEAVDRVERKPGHGEADNRHDRPGDPLLVGQQKSPAATPTTMTVVETGSRKSSTGPGARSRNRTSSP